MAVFQDTGTVSKKSALIAAALASFLTPFTGSSINTALPAIGGELKMDAVLMGWVSTSFLLAAAIFLVPFGRLADIHGRKRIFVYGISTYFVASLLSIFSPNSLSLIALRVLQGIGSAMIFGTGIAILSSVFPPDERGTALGINVAAVYLGLSLGPPGGGLLTHYWGWRAIFLVTLPLALVIIWICITRLRTEWADARGEKFDLAGSILYGLSLFSCMYGLSLVSIPGILFISAGILGIVAFIKWEMSVQSPLFSIDLFRGNLVFSLSNLAALINYSATFGVAFLLSLYLQYIKGFGPQKSGMVLIAQPVVMTLFSPVAGRLSDKFEPRTVASLGMGVITCGLILLAMLDRATESIYIIACLCLLGIGFALFSSPNTNAVMSSVESRFYGVASGILATMRMNGQMLSMGIVMLLFTLYLGRVEITPPHYHLFLVSMRTAFSVFAVLCFGGIYASLARGRIHERHGPK